MTETEIQANGFKQLANLTARGVPRIQLVEAVNRTLTELADHHSQLFDIRNELARTRLVRLPRAQFVYWPHKQHPQMVNGASVTYLQEQYAVYTVAKDAAFEWMANNEYELWHTETAEAKVFWRDWVVTEIADQQLQFACTYCVAYIEGDVVRSTRESLSACNTKAFQRAASWGPE
jgi:hypothetical protein